MENHLKPRFACDAMLGGLARWLRAAGYDASWHDGIEDRAALVRLARAEGQTVLSSDDDIFGLPSSATASSPPCLCPEA